MNHEPLDRLHLQQIAAAYAAGYRMARAELADDTKYYTLTQCYRKFGRGTVDRWATEGLIEIIKDGTRNSKCRVLAERIELVAHYPLNIFSEIPFYMLSLYISYLYMFSFGLNTHEISRF